MVYLPLNISGIQQFVQKSTIYVLFYSDQKRLFSWNCIFCYFYHRRYYLKLLFEILEEIGKQGSTVVLLSVTYVQFSLGTYIYLPVPLGNRKETVYSTSRSKHHPQFIISGNHQKSIWKGLLIQHAKKFFAWVWLVSLCFLHILNFMKLSQFQGQLFLSYCDLS